MNQRKLLFTIFFLCAAKLGFSQPSIAPVRELKIGDTLPDFVVSRLISGPDKGATTGALYRRGLLLIDIWATYCGGCIDEMPRLDSLAEKFAGRVSVLSVTPEDSSKVTAFFKKRTDLGISHLNIVTSDTVLQQYFKCKLIPHLVWIDQLGVIRFITSEAELDEYNVSDFINHKPLQMVLKHDVLHFEFLKRFHVDDSAYKYRSIISGFADSLSTTDLTNSGLGKRFSAQNMTIMSLYWIAYTNQLNSIVNWSRVELHTRDSMKFIWPTENRGAFMRSRYHHPGGRYGWEFYNWKKDNLYCFDFELPKFTDLATFSKYLNQDLERVFHVHLSTRKKKIPCQVLEKTDCSGCKVPKLSKDSLSWYETKGSRILLHNMRILDFLLLKQESFPGDPFINKTGLNGYYDMELEIKDTTHFDMSTIIEALGQYGIRCTRKTKPYPILVLWDHNTGN